MLGLRRLQGVALLLEVMQVRGYVRKTVLSWAPNRQDSLQLKLIASLSMSSYKMLKIRTIDQEMVLILQN